MLDSINRLYGLEAAYMRYSLSLVSPTVTLLEVCGDFRPFNCLAKHGACWPSRCQVRLTGVDVSEKICQDQNTQGRPDPRRMRAGLQGALSLIAELVVDMISIVGCTVHRADLRICRTVNNSGRA